MAHILKLFEFAEHHGVAQVDVRRRRIHSEIHAQGLLLFDGLLELGLELVLADDFRRALLQIRELFLNRFEFCGRHYFFSHPFSGRTKTRRPSTRNLSSRTMRTASV